MNKKKTALPRMLIKYKDCIPELKNELSLANIMEVPKVEIGRAHV